MPATHNTVDHLNALLRGEIAAMETYQQGVEKFAGDPALGEITRIRDDHRGAVAKLREHVHHFGGKPEEGSGVWGVFAKATEGTAKVFGKSTALQALRAGEESGLRSYEEELQNQDWPLECKVVIRELDSLTREHIRALDTLLTA